VQQTVMVLPQVVGIALFPKLARGLAVDPASAREPFLVMARVFVMLSVPVAIGLAVAAEPVLDLAFGDEYRASAPTMRLLAPTLVLGFLSTLLWYVLLAAHRERQVARVLLSGLVLNVGLNFVLIPSMGPEGAALSLLISDVLLLTINMTLLHRMVFRIDVGALAFKPLLALAGAAVPGLLLWQVSHLLAGVCAAVAFFAIAQALRYVTAEEWRPVTGPALDILGRRFRRRAS
jgi:O-antigen/teichoic acid export membrane protein